MENKVVTQFTGVFDQKVFSGVDKNGKSYTIFTFSHKTSEKFTQRYKQIAYGFEKWILDDVVKSQQSITFNATVGFTVRQYTAKDTGEIKQSVDVSLSKVEIKRLNGQLVDLEKIREIYEIETAGTQSPQEQQYDDILV